MQSRVFLLCITATFMIVKGLNTSSTSGNETQVMICQVWGGLLIYLMQVSPKAELKTSQLWEKCLNVAISWRYTLELLVYVFSYDSAISREDCFKMSNISEGAVLHSLVNLIILFCETPQRHVGEQRNTK